MNHHKVKNGRKSIQHAGFAALVKIDVNVAPAGKPPKIVKKFVRVGPCLPNRNSVEKYLKEDYIGQVEDYRIVGVRIDATPFAAYGNRESEEAAK